MQSRTKPAHANPQFIVHTEITNVLRIGVALEPFCARETLDDDDEDDEDG